MNKYQEALYCLNNEDIGMLARHCLDIIQELVDKATPKKPIRFKNSIYMSNPKCPICKTIPHTGNQKYCDECGQALDWSDIEDE